MNKKKLRGKYTSDELDVLLIISHKHETNSWALLFRDTFTPVLSVKVSEHAGTFYESIGTKYRVPEHHPLVFLQIIAVLLY